MEDIDISVHCEIPIFDWLIKWVKKDLKPKNEWPSLGIYYLTIIKINVPSRFSASAIFCGALSKVKNNSDDILFCLSYLKFWCCFNVGELVRVVM